MHNSTLYSRSYSRRKILVWVQEAKTLDRFDRQLHVYGAKNANSNSLAGNLEEAVFSCLASNLDVIHHFFYKKPQSIRTPPPILDKKQWTYTRSIRRPTARVS